jgi:hypothetical protein
MVMTEPLLWAGLQFSKQPCPAGGGILFSRWEQWGSESTKPCLEEWQYRIGSQVWAKARDGCIPPQCHDRTPGSKARRQPGKAKPSPLLPWALLPSASVPFLCSWFFICPSHPLLKASWIFFPLSVLTSPWSRTGSTVVTPKTKKDPSKKMFLLCNYELQSWPVITEAEPWSSKGRQWAAQE